MIHRRLHLMSDIRGSPGRSDELEGTQALVTGLLLVNTDRLRQLAE